MKISTAKANNTDLNEMPLYIGLCYGIHCMYMYMYIYGMLHVVHIVFIQFIFISCTSVTRWSGNIVLHYVSLGFDRIFLAYDV